MKKLLLALIVGLCLLTGCQEKPQPLTLTATSPSGAPALAFLPLMKEDSQTVELVMGPDPLTAQFLLPADKAKTLIMAPINLGVKLISDKDADYFLHSVVTWSNLKLLSKEGAETKKAAFFGKEAVIGKILEAISIKDMLGGAEEQWFSSVSEAQGAFLAGQADYVVLPEPLATASLAKMKKENPDVKVKVVDLKDEVSAKLGIDNFPQAALFVNKTQYKDHKEEIDKVIETMAAYIDNPTTLQEDVENFGNDTLGLPKAQLLVKAYDKMNLKMVKAEDAKEAIQSFLKLFNLELNEKVLK